MAQGESLVKGHNSKGRICLDNVPVFSITVYLLVKLYGDLCSTASSTHFK